MKALVTGGAGFLGSHLCRELLYRGNEVLCVDNLSTGSKRNIRIDDDRFEFMRHDVTFPLYVEVDAIFNLACPASPVHYQRDPVQTTKTCVLGTINMLGLAKRTGARLLQASTSEIYGDAKEHPQDESYWGNVNPIGPRSCYDEGKRCAESLCFDYERQHNVDVRIARIFNTYGPRMARDDGRVVSNFIMQAKYDNPLTVYGSGQNVRSLCYVDDLIDGLLKLYDCEPDMIGADPVNLGDERSPITVLDLAKTIIRLLDSESEIVHRDAVVDDPSHRCPDLTRARQLLHFNPQTTLDEGLQRTIDYFFP